MLAVVRAVFVVSGRAVLRRGVALLAAVGIASAIVFGGNGLQPRVLVAALHASAAVRASLWAAWALLALPVVAPGLDAPGTRTLRALQVARGPLLATLVALFALVELPWAALLGVGGGLAQGLVATALAVAIHSGVLAARSRWAAVGLTTVAASLALLDLPPWIACAPAAALAITGVRLAWKHGLDSAPFVVVPTRPGPAFLALGLAHLLRLARLERARLAVAALAVSAGAAALSLSLAHDPSPAPARRGALVMDLPLVVATAVLAGPLVDGERRLGPWLRALRVRSWTVAAAFLVALVTPSSALAAGAGALAAQAAGVPRGAVSGGVALTGAVVAATIGAFARAHGRNGRRGPAVFVLGALAIGGAWLGAVLAW